MRGVRNTDRYARKFITIVDDFKCEDIARLMETDEYKDDFNKVINDALDYGLPQLLKVAYGEIEEDGLPSVQPQGYELLVNDFDSDKLAEILDLFEEVLLNATLNKSMVASLFNEKTKRLGGQTVKPDSFESGVLSTTPPYLAEHERMVLNRISKSRQERACRDEGGDN
ncbi:MAG: hypothetical protein ACI4M0_05875 [Christensenellales bacterium]